MSPLNSTDQPADRPVEALGDEVVARIEKRGLLLGNVEFQIEQHLLEHGTRIAPETRWFLAQVRDVLETASRDSLERGREELAASPEGAPATGGADSPSHGGAGDGAIPADDAPDADDIPSHRLATRLSVLKSAAHGAAGAMGGALLVLLALHWGIFAGPSDPEAGLDGAFAHSPEAAPQAFATPGPDSAHGRPAPGSAARPAPGHEPREIVLARLEARPGDADHPQAYRRAPSAAIESLDAKAIAAAEGALDLSARDRRQIQRRLELAGFDPKAVDGVFGPATRGALREWQAASGSLPTGYLDDTKLAVLTAETEEGYRSWRAAERARAPAETTRTAALTSPLPPASPEGRPGCERAASGEIIYGQGVRCDFRGLKEDIRQLLRGKRPSQDVAQAERSRASDGA